MVFYIDLSYCNGCGNCQLACKDEHVGNDWTPYAKAQPEIGQFWMKLDLTTCGSAPKLKTDGEKYMMPAWHYDKGTFCARNSGFGRGAAEQYVKHALALIRTLL